MIRNVFSKRCLHKGIKVHERGNKAGIVLPAPTLDRYFESESKEVPLRAPPLLLTIVRCIAGNLSALKFQFTDIAAPHYEIVERLKVWITLF